MRKSMGWREVQDRELGPAEQTVVIENWPAPQLVVAMQEVAGGTITPIDSNVKFPSKPSSTPLCGALATAMEEIAHGLPLPVKTQGVTTPRDWSNQLPLD